MRIAVFCIPAHGHTNPTLPVVQELVKRGHTVRYYSFAEFAEKIRATGAEFIPCDTYLPALTEQESAGLKAVSTTEMTIQDLRITMQMDAFLSKEFAEFRPDVVFSDSVCFWGKLNAWKHHVPLVVSTSTFAFNRFSSKYMKQSPKEIADVLLGTPKVQKELKKLRDLGYPCKSILSLVQSDDKTDSVVYAARSFQPYAETFSGHYLFAGPSVFTKTLPDKAKARPLVYISLGTVINDRPDFYKNCIEALRTMPVDVVISCGANRSEKLPETLPDNVQVFEHVDQPELLAKTDVFISHCGMNSVSESLYMAAPLVLYPQSAEQYAVAARAAECGAGIFLKDDSPEGIRNTVTEILQHPKYAEAAAACSSDFRACPGTAGAADFIEQAPHTVTEKSIADELNRKSIAFRFAYYTFFVLLTILLCGILKWKAGWIFGAAAGVFSNVIFQKADQLHYQKTIRREASGCNRPFSKSAAGTADFVHCDGKSGKT